MYLEKLEIQGFKSFAHKNILVFPGMMDNDKRGLTAIVGPNGSGKSNVSDAVRWALGEQSMKMLRGKKGEDIIFAGSDKKGQLGMAEVSLFFNNEDGQAPIEYAQVVLTRRLYRSGESEYLLNNTKVRLSDIQMLLAKAKFGQKTYSVIGQGTVEGFLNTSLSERKEFFDEATGVKQYQIKRDDALNKLGSSYENLGQAQMLLNEIEPRLKSLTRQVGKLQKRGELEQELKNFQLIYYRYAWHEINDKFVSYNNEYLQIEKLKLDKEKKLDNLNRELGQLEKDNAANSEYAFLQNEINKLQTEKDIIIKRVARAEAEMEIDMEAKGETDLAFLSERLSEVNLENKKIEEEIAMLKGGVKQIENKLHLLTIHKEEIGIKINVATKKINELSSFAGHKNSGSALEKISLTLKRLWQAEAIDDLVEIKKIIREIKQELDDIMGTDITDKEKIEFESAQADMQKLSAEKENILTELAAEKERAAALRERLSFFIEQSAKLRLDAENLNNKIFNKTKNRQASEQEADLEKLNSEAKKVEEKLAELKLKLSKLAQAEEDKRNKLFSLQKHIHALQNEINAISFNLNEMRINSTRYETKLENIEKDIRQDLGSLKEIKEKRTMGEINADELQEKIKNVKKQLEHIGGIDPAVEKEYVETKERFDFLFNQVSDLEKTIDSLEKVIKELDVTIKEIFDKEFKIISAKFEEYFKILFNGGKAKIIKVLEEEKDIAEAENENVANIAGGIDSRNMDLKKIKYLQKHNATGLAGIEIQATPPGKKIQSISMLSGGERALTAIALISAIISANPSPFVMLDEVDAALDEANSERLAKILDDLSHKTQFIVITHNRASMRRAVILYGVTMGDDGVSKLLSIKLEEAKAINKAV
jgi:chromosome segregation protein